MSNANEVVSTETTENTQSPVTQIDYSEMENVYLRDVFPEVVPKTATAVIRRPKHRHPDVPREVFGYVPDELHIKNALSWFLSPNRPQFMHLVGPTGSGKTDFCLWFCSRLNWPLNLVSVNSAIKGEKMQGRWLLANGETRYVYGPVADAMKHGKAVLLDECDKGSMEFIAKMHLPSEMNKPWVIEDTGEIIYPSENFRFITTGNTNGQGSSPLYTSSKRWDTAFRNRAYILNFGYPSAKLELKIVNGKYEYTKSFPKTTRELIKFANKMRDAMLGPDRSGIFANPADVGITTAFSTRILLSWLHFIHAQGDTVPLRRSLETCFLNGLDDKEREDIMNIVDAVFKDSRGHILDYPIGFIEADFKDIWSKKGKK